MARQTPKAIEIDYTKLLAWLIDQRRIPLKWHTHLKTARSLARAAYMDTPHEALDVLSLPSALEAHDFVTFQTVHRVLSAMDQSDGDLDHRAIFSSTDDMQQCRKQWQQAKRAFERDHVFLADAAQQLVRYTDVDAPALRDRLIKLSAEASDTARKGTIAVRSAADAAIRFDDAFDRYELDGGSNKTERHVNDIEHIDLDALVKSYVTKHVPGVLTQAAEAACKLSDVLDYYDAFANFMVALSTKKLNDDDDASTIGRCPTLRTIIGTDLAQMVSPKNQNRLSMSEASKLNLCKGPGEDEEYVNRSVINLNIESPPGSSDETARIAVEGNGHADSITLSDVETREAFLDDLAEVEAFLEQRLIEVNKQGTAGFELNVLANLQRSLDENLIRNPEELGVMAERVKLARVALTGKTARHVLTLQGNERAFQRACIGLMQRKQDKRRAQEVIVALNRRQKSATMELEQVTEELNCIHKVTADVVRHCEETLSNLYGGREVNILGNVRRLIVGR